MPKEAYYPEHELPPFRRDLRIIKANAEDVFWIEDNLNFVYHTIEATIKDTRLYFLTVESLMELLATAMVYPISDPWLRQVIQTVLDHPADPSNPFQNALLGALEEFIPLAGVFGSRETETEERTDALLHAYTTLVKTLTFNRGTLINEKLMEQANKLASGKTHKRIYSEYYQALALCCAHRGDLFLGLELGRRAFCQYENNEDAPGSADAATTLAILYCRDDNLREARRYLNMARKRADQEPVKNKLLATMFYEQGAISYKAEDYASALEYYRMALTIFEDFDARYQVAMTHHANALCYCELRQLDKAGHEIEFARKFWKEIDNRYEQAALQLLDGRVEFWRDNRTLALQQLNHAREMALCLDDSPARDTLIGRIDKFLNEHYPPYKLPTITPPLN